jgi:photosystem II stability/assembly factor-like uncharacterized protein
MAVTGLPALVALALLALIPGSVSTAAEISFDSSTFGALRARSIGPAAMSGRIAALDAVPGETLTVYVGAASGGVWKSTDGGLTFEPIFDDHTQSIGAITVDRANPDVVWVGTGETWTRNSVSVGTGIYKSTDAGETWKQVGLADSERIARIVLDPEDSDTVYVCATGHLWDANEERGVYKSTDGGETWERILHVDADTGCADIDIDPQDGRILYAGMWQFRRQPWTFSSGGPGSGLFKSTDGGTTWKKLTQDLPEGDLGRIAVAVAPSRPRVIYAVVEAEETALYCSEDLGEHWTSVNNAMAVSMRPFYFARLVVDPTDHDIVYKGGFLLGKSIDGGGSFTGTFSGNFSMNVHPDHHAIWVNPENPRQVLDGTDGGLYASEDQGRHWRFIRGLPISQFYHASTDMDWPYNVYGGLQDNGTWKGPSRSPGGIENRDWQVIGYGDGFHAHVDRVDPDIVYVEYQGGKLLRRNQATGELKAIEPYPGEGEPKLRFNWNTPIHVSRARPGTIYAGAQFLFRSADQGESWQRISPDLTTDDPEKQKQEESGGLTIDNSTAENHTTIYAISESPLDGDVIWVGTDDGNLQLTRDGGKSWTNLIANVPDLPAHTWVSSLEAGPHDAATAFVTFDGHRTGDMTTYVYSTADFGQTWTPLASESTDGYAHVIRQDLVNHELLFLGTEMGLYLSLDGGEQWARFKENLPRVAVRNLEIHPREGDLIVATHGRGIYIIDDLSPIRGLTREIVESDAAILPSRPAVMVISSPEMAFNGDGEFTGRNPSGVATIHYYLKKRHLFGDLKIEVYDGEGKLISTLPGGKRVGINRVEWPMRLPAPKVPPATSLVPAFQGPSVAEGTYNFKLIKGKNSYDGQVTLAPDPRSPHTMEDRRFQQDAAMRLYRRLADLTYVTEALMDLRDQARERAGELEEKDRLRGRVEEFADELETFRETLVVTSRAGMLSGQERLREKLGNLYGNVNGYEGRPTRSQLDRVDLLVAELEEKTAEFDTLAADGLKSLAPQLEKKKLAPLKLLTREEWEEEQG